MRKRDTVYTVKCEKCGKEYTIKYLAYTKSKHHICKQCSGIERVNDLHEGNKKYFSDPENRKRHSELCKEIWEQRPEEFKINRIQNLADVGKSYRDGVDFSAIASERAKKYYSNPENRKLASDKKKAYWESLSADDKKSAMIHLTKYWDDLSPDELDRLYKNELDGMIAAEAVKIGKSEEMFCNSIDKLPLRRMIEYKRQYRSETKHPDFDKLFPINQITGGKYVNPYHIWDFILCSGIMKILVDIDGSIHNIQPGNVKYGNKTVDLSELIKFRDSQRPYQTDGLPAYIVQAYDDEITDDTIVTSVKDNSVMKYHDFMVEIMILCSQNDDI